VIGDGLLPNDDRSSKRLWHCAEEKTNVLLENLCSTTAALSLEKEIGGGGDTHTIFHKEGPTCDDHGGFSLYVLLFPGTFVKLLLTQGHLVRLDVATLRVLKDKPQMTTCTDDSLTQQQRLRRQS